MEKPIVHLQNKIFHEFSKAYLFSFGFQNLNIIFIYPDDPHDSKSILKGYCTR